MDQIRRLYESDAQGLLDLALLEEVFIAILARCEAIHLVDEARAGRVVCPTCGTKIQRGAPLPGKSRHSTEQIRCPQCSWETTWGAFHRSFDGKQLTGGGAAPFVKEFRENAAAAASPQQKLRMIDRIIHQFHTWRDTPTRPCAVNVIAGKPHEVLALLDALAEGPTVASSEAQDARGKFWHARTPSRRR
jgi:predicted RNA-binding Zn-ribbon protein involved in translation (DUF1610 family)